MGSEQYLSKYWLVVNMIYKLTDYKSQDLDNFFNKTIKELETFFSIKQLFSKPKLMLVNDHEQMESLADKKLPLWVNGNIFGQFVMVLCPENYEQECNHKYDDDVYHKLIKHELVHFFFEQLSNNNVKPCWLSEGASMYLSGQLEPHKKPIKFNNFINYYSKHDAGVYLESGFVVETLVKFGGKSRLLRLIKGLSNARTKKLFETLFETVYGFKLNYKTINEVYADT
ncbi:MAG: hypothetical protein WC307_03805 [Candidatus Nanoarchaeia archaeon]|jgi:hypothetical protein